MIDVHVRTRRLITALSLLIAGTVTVLLPLVVGFQSYRKEAVEIELLAAVFAEQIGSQHADAAARPRDPALRAVIGSRFEPERGDESRRVEDGQGRILAELGTPPPPPRLVRAAPFRIDGQVAGNVVIVRSGRHVIELALFALILGGSLGIGIYLVLSHLPLKDLERMLASLAEEKARSHQMFAYARDGMLSYDDYLRVRDVNKAAEELFGRDREALIGQPLHGLFDAINRVAAQAGGNIWLDAGRVFEIDARNADGSLVPVEVSIGLVGERKDICRIAVIRDIAERKQAEFDLNLFVNYDSLTRLPNRDHFRALLSGALGRAESRDARVGLIFLDLARFKRINDNLGHAVGDKLLCVAARRIEEALCRLDWPGRRPVGRGEREELVARLGGDEFAVILENIGSAAGAGDIARTLIEALSAPFDIDGHEISIGANAGIALFPDDADFVGRLIRAADLAMYQARNLGRDAFHFYSTSLEVHDPGRLAMEARLRRALELDAFELHYQPILDVASDQVHGVEVLLRWQDGEDNLLLPPDFIEVLEDSGMIREVGDWVIRHACRQLQAWHEAGQHGLRLSVSLSHQQFNHPGLLQSVAGALDASGLDPACLELALNENTLTQEGERFLPTLDALRRLGVRLALDRFGTGLSCLACLRRLPLTTLKIDLFFVHDLVEDAGSRAIAETIVKLGHAFGMETVAVGVEQEAQRELLRDMGCNHYQGFLATPPMSAAACLKWLRQRGDTDDTRESLVF